MNYHLKSKKKHNIKPFIVVISIVLFVVAFRLIAPRFFPTVFHSVARPAWVMKNFVFSNIGHIGGYFKFKETLLDENSHLKDQISALDLKVALVEVLEKENSDIKELLGRKVEKNDIPAFVLARPPQSLYDTLVIDVGEDAHIKKDSRVMIDDNFWLGNVISVYSKTSVVRLLSSPDSKINLIISRTGTPIELNGRGGGNFEGDLPRGVDIQKGDMLVPTGFSSVVVAQVSMIEIDPEDSFQKIYAVIPKNLSLIQDVMVKNGSILKVEEAGVASKTSLIKK